MTDNRTNEPTEAQVEAAAVASINSHRSRAGLPTLATLDGVLNADEWRDDARAALAAADAVCCAHPKCPGGSLCCCQSDAVVTEEMIAETILKALVFTNENSKPWADGLARDIAALSRGGAK